MLAIAETRKNSQEKPEKRKRRPVNPQTQRLWDTMQNFQDGVAREPTYSANMAPLVTRARTLQRRLRAMNQVIELQETSVNQVLTAMAASLEMGDDLAMRFRNFEHGRSTRRKIIEKLLSLSVIHRSSDRFLLEQITASVEAFQALITGMVAALYQRGLTLRRPDSFASDEGWVHLPESTSPTTLAKTQQT